MPRRQADPETAIRHALSHHLDRGAINAFAGPGAPKLHEPIELLGAGEWQAETLTGSVLEFFSTEEAHAFCMGLAAGQTIESIHHDRLIADLHKWAAAQ